MDTHPDPLLTAAQALEVLELPRTARATLLRAVRAGQLTADTHTPGGHRRFRLSEVVRYRDELRMRARLHSAAGDAWDLPAQWA